MLCGVLPLRALVLLPPGELLCWGGLVSGSRLWMSLMSSVPSGAMAALLRARLALGALVSLPRLLVSPAMLMSIMRPLVKPCLSGFLGGLRP